MLKVHPSQHSYDITLLQHHSHHTVPRSLFPSYKSRSSSRHLFTFTYTIMSSSNDNNNDNNNNTNNNNIAMKQLLCGGIAGATAKTVTAPFSRLTILYQVHSMVTTKKHHPKFALSLDGGFRKIVERGGWQSMWRGNFTSVLHRFPYSAINFYVYEHMLDMLHSNPEEQQEEERTETTQQLARRLTLQEQTGTI